MKELTARLRGVEPAANGDPGTGVSAPLLASTANADTSLLPLLPTYRCPLSGVPAIEYSDRPPVATVFTETIAPVVASMPNAEMVLSVEFVTYANSPHTMPTLVTLAVAMPPSLFVTAHRCDGDWGCCWMSTRYCLLGS